MERATRIYVPKWALVLYAIIAIGLIPWIFNLAANLPTRHLVHHWDAVWVGFDVIMFLTLGLTIVLAFKKLVWVAMSATALATLFIVDAWFDVLTSRPGKDQKEAIIFGILELLLAGLTLRFVRQVVRSSTNTDKNIQLVTNAKK